MHGARAIHSLLKNEHACFFSFLHRLFRWNFGEDEVKDDDDFPLSPRLRLAKMHFLSKNSLEIESFSAKLAGKGERNIRHQNGKAHWRKNSEHVFTRASSDGGGRNSSLIVAGSKECSSSFSHGAIYMTMTMTSASCAKKEFPTL